MIVKVCLMILLFFGAGASCRAADGRDWWDVLHYDISIKPDYDNKFIAGANTIRFRVLQPGATMQIDLQQPMSITSISWHGQDLLYERTGDAYTIRFPRQLEKDEIDSVFIEFEGKPHEAVHAPFDNGWIFAKDKKGRPWMSVTCEGSGAAVWLPCKNILSDEPDSGVTLAITVPDTLVAVGNGRLKDKTVEKNGWTTWHWAVVNTINHYDIIPYIGAYTHWQETFPGEKGALDCDYWVLDYNLAAAKQQFKQVDSILTCFEHWMGPYPFYEDSYKVVEAPHPGMEHQSAIAYGNGFSNGLGGKDLSGTGWGLQWDFILVHETAHEWFGNSITAKGDGDSWIHEAFAKYAEALYTSSVSGKAAGNEYAIGIWKRIHNDEPIVSGDTQDKYNKGSAMLHMIRQLLGDEAFRSLLRALNKHFYHQTVGTAELTAFCSRFSGHDLSKIFDQYLRTTKIPVFEYAIHDHVPQYRWANCVKGFNMPIRVRLDGQTPQLLHPTEIWQSITDTPGKTMTVDRNFYVKVSSTPAF